MIEILRAIGTRLLRRTICTADRRLPNKSCLQISVFSSGKVLLDGKEASVSEVKKALEKARVAKGAVWYYRESGKGEPPSQAIEIVKLVVENKLPISLSSKPDFSDYIDDEGHSRPRE